MARLQNRLGFVLLLIFGVVVLNSGEEAAAADTCDASVTIQITINASKMCTQISPQSPNAVGAPVLVNYKDCIKFQAADNTKTLQVRFAKGTSPFYDFNAAPGQTVTAGPLPQDGTPGETIYYNSVQIGGDYCLNGKSLGLIMK